MHAAVPFRDNLHAAGLMVGAMTLFTLNDACLKAVTAEVPLFQALFIRSVGTTLFLGAILLGHGGFRHLAAAGPGDRRLILLRSLAEVAAAYFFLTALTHMPIANVTAVLQVLPLAVTLAAAVFLGEPVGWRRVSAIAAGAVGVLIIVRPGPEGFNPFAVYALIAVAAVTLRDLCARRLSREVPSLLVSVAAAVAVLIFSGVASLGVDWVMPSPVAALLLAASTGFIILAYQLSVMTMRTGEIAFVAPFRYAGILVALLVGLAAFGEWPDPLTLTGVAIVVGAGMYTFIREHRRARATH